MSSRTPTIKREELAATRRNREVALPHFQVDLQRWEVSRPRLELELEDFETQLRPPS